MELISCVFKVSIFCWEKTAGTYSVITYKTVHNLRVKEMLPVFLWCAVLNPQSLYVEALERGR